MIQHAQGDLAEAAALVVLRAPDLPVEQDLLVGHPIAVLVAESRRADLVVLGAPRRRS